MAIGKPLICRKSNYQFALQVGITIIGQYQASHGVVVSPSAESIAWHRHNVQGDKRSDPIRISRPIAAMHQSVT
jgi:hypothetical protein